MLNSSGIFYYMKFVKNILLIFFICDFVAGEGPLFGILRIVVFDVGENVYHGDTEIQNLYVIMIRLGASDRRLNN